MSDARVRQFANDFMSETVQGIVIDGFSEADPGPAWSPNDNAPRPAPTPVPMSPLIPTPNWPAPNPTISTVPTEIPNINADDLKIPEPTIHDLWVGDRQAEFKGQAVDLTPQEHAAIASIVLRAIQRRVQGQMKEVAGVMRRTRPEAPVVAPKRGRPFGSKNKPKGE